MKQEFVSKWSNWWSLQNRGNEMTEAFIRELNAIIDREIKNSLPSDKECEEWYDANIDKNCSASSAIYKFRLWLNERAKVSDSGIKLKLYDDSGDSLDVFGRIIIEGTNISIASYNGHYQQQWCKKIVDLFNAKQ